ncbi:MAG: hypothetical protein HY680_03555 [Chloroflexi bacterium]|nr:hypothetical protein [Chloroflexota bacterium]
MRIAVHGAGGMAGSMGSFLERAILSNLTPEEAGHWRIAAQQARSEGTFMLVRAFHCAVGTKASL